MHINIAFFLGIRGPQKKSLVIKYMQLAKPAGVTSHWGMQCRRVLGREQCLKGSAPWCGQCQVSFGLECLPCAPNTDWGQHLLTKNMPL